MSSKRAIVKLANTGNADRTMLIDGVVYKLDGYELDSLITGLQTIRDVSFSTVECSIEIGDKN